MANADIIVVGPSELSTIIDLYNEVFAPRRDIDFFERRFRGRENTLSLIAEIDKCPVGFSLGFELKPTTWTNWLMGVRPDYRRQGIASQLTQAEQAWAVDHGYRYLRTECHNRHRPILHLAISHGFDVVGVRWDSERHSNLVIFEKDLAEDDPD